MIELAQVEKVVAGSTALQVDALTVPAGEVAAVVGSAGSGREVLLDLLIGRERPSAGTVRVGGYDPVADRDALGGIIGVLFSEDTLYGRMTALANLQLYARLYGLPRERAAETLTQVGLADMGSVRADKLPSGLARRLAFGRAILHQPRALLLSDPFDRCDEASIALLRQLIRDQSSAGAAVLVLSDTQSHLAGTVDITFLLESGHVADTIRAGESRDGLPFKIAVRQEGRVALINPADILFAETQDGRVFVQTTTEHIPTPFTMTELEDRLARQGFFRAHRGYLVNLQHVREVIPYTRSSFSLKLDDTGGTKIPLSKEAAAELRELLDY